MNHNTLTQDLRYRKISQEEYDETLIERNVAWRALSPADQLASLDRRLGVGIGAARQRKLLAAKLAAPVVVPVEAPVAAPGEPAVIVTKKKFKKGNKK
jgi:hypothetical protein